MIRGYLLLAVLAALMSALRSSGTRDRTRRPGAPSWSAPPSSAGRPASPPRSPSRSARTSPDGRCWDWPGSRRAARARVVHGRDGDGALGIVFAGVAAVTVQLSSTTRGASGFAAAVLGLAFVVGGVGNMLGHVDATGLRLVSAWPAWLSPLGGGSRCARSAATTGGRLPCSPRLRRPRRRGGLARNSARRRQRHPPASAVGRGGAARAPQPVRARLAPATERPARLDGRDGRIRPRVRRHLRRDEGPVGAPRPSGTRAWAARTRSSTRTGRRSSRWPAWPSRSTRFRSCSGCAPRRPTAGWSPSSRFGESTAVDDESPPQRRARRATPAPRLRCEHGRGRRGGARRHPGAAPLRLSERALSSCRRSADRGSRRRPHRAAAARASASPGRCSSWRSCSGRCSARQPPAAARAQDVSPFTHTPKLPGAELAALPVFGLIVISAVLVAAALASFRAPQRRPPDVRASDPRRRR